MTARAGAHEVIAAVLDPNSFESWDEPIPLDGLPTTYAEELARAAERAGTDESVLTGRGRVGGRDVVVVVSEFRFLGGSIGAATAARIVAAVRRATAERLPVLAAPASGGTRMQEGTPAFVRMADIARVLMAHRAEGLPYLAYLRHPTTGGVFASWGSLAQVTAAEPGALIGFLGPKVYDALRGEPFPAGVQTAENLAAHGIVDAVVPLDELRALVAATLAVLLDPPTRPALAAPRNGAAEQDAWAAISATRGTDRVGVRDLLRYAATATVRLHGTVEGERDNAILVALTRLDGRPCVLVGQDRERQGPGAELGPASLRQARRGMRLAEELGLPLVTVIDTPGAELSKAAEEGALAGEIARCIAALTSMTVPTVSVLLGQGCGGGALALFPAATRIAAARSWLSPLPPEGASVIVHGDVTHAPAIARRQRVAAADLYADGLVHRVVAEPATATRRELAGAVAASVVEELARSQRALAAGAAS